MSCRVRVGPTFTYSGGGVVSLVEEKVCKSQDEMNVVRCYIIYVVIACRLPLGRDCFHSRVSVQGAVVLRIRDAVVGA